MDSFIRSLHGMANVSDTRSAHDIKVLPEALQEDLRSKLRDLNTKHEFSVGQLVRAKPGMNVSITKGIVYAIGDVAADYLGKIAERGRAAYKDPVCDLIVGLIDQSDGEFLLYPTWTQRWEPWPDEGARS